MGRGAVWLVRCGVCDKRAFVSRSEARRAARTTPRDRGRRCHAYRCPEGYWHVGHIPTVIRNGQIPRKEYRPS